jgi:hypothetical protein
LGLREHAALHFRCIPIGSFYLVGYVASQYDFPSIALLLVEATSSLNYFYTVEIFSLSRYAPSPTKSIMIVTFLV